MKEGGCASVVNAIVLEVFNTNPAVAKCRTRLSNKFCAALELAMSEWRLANPHGGVDLGDDMPRLLDLRFADDILRTGHKAVCCRRKKQADDRTILTTDYKVRPVHSMFTNGFSVTKWFQWHLD